MCRFTLLLLPLFLFTLTPTHAKPEGVCVSTDYNLAQFWVFELDNGEDKPLTFGVHLSHIASVSYHKYIMDNMWIYEVTLVTTGGVPTKFYYAELPKNLNRLSSPASKASDIISSKTGIDPRTTVAKAYPHTNTVEYRLGNLKDLQNLHTSLHNAWLSGTSAKFSTSL